ncbi:type II toxin-antitoxin system VapC family toxin [Rhizobium panacihumi]|uniref:type II toxin-antitoxin system VapC family toxin n=1 Tax=Rhizobium panacihumi TaxID=2008450 RepID=UPI003D7BC685
MSGFLLDTNIISTTSPTHAQTNGQFGEWLRQQVRLDTVFLSVVTVHEIAKGIALLTHKGATLKAERLAAWLDIVRNDFDDRILAFDAEIAMFAGQLEAVAISNGYSPDMADAMIAATAKRNDLIVVTRNLRHFDIFNVATASSDALSG